MLGLLNPWTLLGIGVALVISHGTVGYKAYQFGGNAQKVICERRVDELQSRWEAEIAKVNATNKAWTDAITKVLEAGNEEAAKAQAEIEALNQKVRDYEATLSDNPACLLTDPDIDKLR